MNMEFMMAGGNWSQAMKAPGEIDFAKAIGLLREAAALVGVENFGIAYVDVVSSTMLQSIFSGPAASELESQIMRILAQGSAVTHESNNRVPKMFVYSMDKDVSDASHSPVSSFLSIPAPSRFEVLVSLSEVSKTTANIVIMETPITQNVADKLTAAGAVGWVATHLVPSAVTKGVDEVSRPTEKPLSPREKQCLWWSANGKTSQEIALITGLSSHTVNAYLVNAGQKLDAVNRAHAIAIALRQGLIDEMDG